MYTGPKKFWTSSLVCKHTLVQKLFTASRDRAHVRTSPPFRARERAAGHWHVLVQQVFIATLQVFTGPAPAEKALDQPGVPAVAGGVPAVLQKSPVFGAAE